jgi:hypothetical protein
MKATTVDELEKLLSIQDTDCEVVIVDLSGEERGIDVVFDGVSKVQLMEVDNG